MNDYSPMKLYVTPTSPYARLVMIVRLEKHLEDRVELVWTRTRNPDDPMLAVNPSGRVPFLMLDDATVFEDSDVIIDYFDHLAPPSPSGAVEIAPPGSEAYWVHRRRLAMSRSLLDGLSVWAREVTRPETEQSPGIIDHERRRAARLTDYFEVLAQEPPFSAISDDRPAEMSELVLFCALSLDKRLPDFDWRTAHPALSDWYGRISARPSVHGSEPPPGV